jgi:hypothetical protein
VGRNTRFVAGDELAGWSIFRKTVAARKKALTPALSHPMGEGEVVQASSI